MQYGLLMCLLLFSVDLLRGQWASFNGGSVLSTWDCKVQKLWRNKNWWWQQCNTLDSSCSSTLQEKRKLDRNTSDDKQTTTSVLQLLSNETVLNDGSVCYCTASLHDPWYDFVSRKQKRHCLHYSKLVAVNHILMKINDTLRERLHRGTQADWLKEECWKKWISEAAVLINIFKAHWKSEKQGNTQVQRCKCILKTMCLVGLFD